MGSVSQKKKSSPKKKTPVKENVKKFTKKHKIAIGLSVGSTVVALGVLGASLSYKKHKENIKNLNFLAKTLKNVSKKTENIQKYAADTQKDTTDFVLGNLKQGEINREKKLEEIKNQTTATGEVKDTPIIAPGGWTFY